MPLADIVFPFVTNYFREHFSDEELEKYRGNLNQIFPNREEITEAYHIAERYLTILRHFKKGQLANTDNIFHGEVARSEAEFGGRSALQQLQVDINKLIEDRSTVWISEEQRRALLVALLNLKAMLLQNQRVHIGQELEKMPKSEPTSSAMAQGAEGAAQDADTMRMQAEKLAQVQQVQARMRAEQEHLLAEAECALIQALAITPMTADVAHTVTDTVTVAIAMSATSVHEEAVRLQKISHTTLLANYIGVLQLQVDTAATSSDKQAASAKLLTCHADFTVATEMLPVVDASSAKRDVLNAAYCRFILARATQNLPGFGFGEQLEFWFDTDAQASCSAGKYPGVKNFSVLSVVKLEELDALYQRFNADLRLLAASFDYHSNVLTNNTGILFFKVAGFYHSMIRPRVTAVNTVGVSSVDVSAVETLMNTDVTDVVDATAADTAREANAIWIAKRDAALRKAGACFQTNIDKDTKHQFAVAPKYALYVHIAMHMVGMLDAATCLRESEKLMQHFAKAINMPANYDPNGAYAVENQKICAGMARHFAALKASEERAMRAREDAAMAMAAQRATVAQRDTVVVVASGHGSDHNDDDLEGDMGERQHTAMPHESQNVPYDTTAVVVSPMVFSAPLPAVETRTEGDPLEHRGGGAALASVVSALESNSATVVPRQEGTKVMTPRTRARLGM